MKNVKDENIEPKMLEEINKILEDKTLSFFPKSGGWGGYCFGRPKEVGYGYLPCHLRDSKWLAKLLLKETNLPNQYYKNVLYFVQTSELFGNKRHEYELEIVRWQIDFIKHNGEGWICDEKLGGNMSLIMPMCDIAFRKGVLDTLVAIGMDKEVIEEGLEKNADMWRDNYINRAFEIEYEPILYNFLGSDEGKEIPPVNPKHKEAWIKMRYYEYYCDHKKSVDLYGTITPEMKISKEEVEELKKYLDVENMKRKTLINMIIHSENTNLYYKDENSEQKSEDTIYFKRLKKWLDKIRQK